MPDSSSSGSRNRLQSILIVVHPGSACGSANFNLGRNLADGCREVLTNDILAWQGPIIVIDSDLSSDLEDPRFADLGAAIAEATERARAAGRLGLRVVGSDDTLPGEDNQSQAISGVVACYQLSPDQHRFEVTGCWYDPEEDYGCVNDVRDTLAAAGFDTSIRDSAISLDEEVDEQDDDEVRGAMLAFFNRTDGEG